MGTQQILLLVLSVIIVGVSIASALVLIENRIQIDNRNAIIRDMYDIATQAIIYYKTPSNQGGGSESWDIDTFYASSGYPTNDNGTKLITQNGTIKVTETARGKLRIVGWGNEIGSDDDKAIKARLVLSGSTADDMNFIILN